MWITFINKEDELRNKLVDYANSCDREAGPILAEKMKSDSFSDWEKIFVATEDNNIVIVLSPRRTEFQIVNTPLSLDLSL